MAQDPFDAFLQRLSAGHTPNLVTIYHAVRNIPYGAIGQRDPRAVLERGVGSCSGKHLLLQELLRRLGHEADVVTIFTHFNELVPDHDGYPPALRELVRDAVVPDFHHFVRARQNGRWLRLDATWHDALAPYGFPVNADWSGEGDTWLAARSLREYPPTDDLVALKQRLLSELSPEELALRARFFELLTAWIATL